MRNALADAVVDGHEGAVRFERLLDGARQQLRVCANSGWIKACRKVGQRFVVVFRNQQRVAWKHRPMIEKRERRFIFENDGRRHWIPRRSRRRRSLRPAQPRPITLAASSSAVSIRKSGGYSANVSG